MHAVGCPSILPHLDIISLWPNELAEEVVQHGHHSVHHGLNHNSPVCVYVSAAESGQVNKY